MSRVVSAVYGSMHEHEHDNNHCQSLAMDVALYARCIVYASDRTVATEVQSIAAHQEEVHHLIEKPPFS